MTISSWCLQQVRVDLEKKKKKEKRDYEWVHDKIMEEK